MTRLPHNPQHRICAKPPWPLHKRLYLIAWNAPNPLNN